MQKHKAIALYLSYVAVLAFLAFGSITLVRGINSLGAARRNRASQQALYLSEAAIRTVSYNLSQSVANTDNEAAIPMLTTTPRALSTLTQWTPPAGFFPADFTITYTCQIIGTEQIVTDALGVVTNYLLYEVSATAQHNTYDISINLRQRLSREKNFIFQHAVFYADDLELIPGANMTLSGKIHCNNDIYIAAVAALTINTDYLYTAGDMFNRRKDDGSRPAGSVFVKIFGTSPSIYNTIKQGANYMDSNNANWTLGSQTLWGGTVKSAAHGVTALAVPAVESIQPTGYYATTADLKIIKTNAGGWDITSGGTSVPISSFPTNTITEKTFYDNRAKKNVTVVDIDMAKLNASGYFPANGLLYASRQDATVAQPNGVRLKSGSTLNGKLTTVSNGPIYIQGDFNSVDKKGSAVIADAVNILSNNWNDANSNLAIGSRTATNTTVNSAFVAGNVPTPTGGGAYSGGLENYPRLAENWSSKTLTIRGSFVELWPSSIAKNPWVSDGTCYSAPARNWDYDTDYNNSSNLPPFTPFTVRVRTVAWWQKSAS
jgi:hypothetical protein